MTTAQLRQLLDLPRNTKSRQVWNRAIRLTPGGSELLDRLEKIDYLRVQFPSNSQIVDEVELLRAKRDELIEAMRSGRTTPPKTS